MTFPRARVVVSAILFLSWLTFLLILALRSPTIVVSRPQMMVSGLCVEAEIRDNRGYPDPLVKIVKVFGPAAEGNTNLVGKEIDIPELAWYGKPQGYRGKGTYVLPLMPRAKMAGGGFIIAPIPRVEEFFPRPVQRLTMVELISVPIPSEVFAAATITGLLSAPMQPTWACFTTILASDSNGGEQPVVRCLIEDARKSKADAEILVALVGINRGKGIAIARGWPVKEALLLTRKLKEVGAQARVMEFDVQIYPATPEIVAQVEKTLAAKNK